MPPIRTSTLLFATGIVLTNSLQISHSVIPFIGVSGFFCIFIFCVGSLFKPVRFISLHSLRQSCLLFAASFLCGSYTFMEHTALNDTHISLVALYHSPVTIAGEIIGLSHKASSTELHLEAKKIYADTQYTATYGKIVVRLSRVDTLLMPGQHLLIAGQINPIQGPRNPGDFDYQSYLARSTIHAQLDGDQWIELNHPPPFYSRLRTVISTLRRTISTSLRDAAPSSSTNALLQALILGKQDAIPHSTRQHFRTAGVSHLLAVSGLHVACVGLIVYTLLCPMCLRLGMHWQSMELTRVVATLLLLFTYVCITGFKPAVFRATVMTAIFVLAPLFQRPAASINNLFVAAFVLLLINPTHLFQPGFQLSFAAVASIIHFYPRLPSVSTGSGHLKAMTRYAVNSFNVSLAATIGVLPIGLFYFHMTSPGGLLLNLAAIPATTGILLSGLLVLVSMPISQELAYVFGFSADFCSSALLFMTEYGASSLPSLSLPPSPTRSLFCAFVGLMIFLVPSFNLRLGWRYLGLILSFAVLVQWISLINRSNHPGLEVLFFDVGHGDAALVTMPNGRRLLIDTGDAPWQPGAHVIATHLNRYQIDCIDAVLLTHPDQDHVGGLQQLLDKHCIHTIYTS
ncbi:MAG: DNA internalization-related competence protein ComEC/Rec2, partial [Rhodothermaceae bacterium]|nr:DNA internalization-related competence protein ComEC/Rec2 [Rhodothermaceae bacterium]